MDTWSGKRGIHVALAPDMDNEMLFFSHSVLVMLS
jgi:hypothetical protein